MPTTQPDPNDPWGWNAWAQTQDPGLYGMAKSAITPDNFGAFKGELQAAGKWNPEWDAFANYQAPTGDVGNAGEPGPAAPDLSSLAGYQVGSARSSGYDRINALFDPSGAQIGGDVSQASGSMHGKDYATMAAVLGAGYGMGLGFEALGAGAGLGDTAALGASQVGALGGAAPEVGAGTITGGTGLGTGGVTGLTMGLGEAGAGGMTLGGSAGGLTAAGSAAGGTTATGLASTGLGAAGGAGGAGGIGSLLSSAGSSLGKMNLGQWAQLGSSLYGLYQGNQMMKMGQNADPFAPYRGQYAAQLNTLMQNPSSVTSLPGYQAGMSQAEQALTRQSASQGLTGSGTTAAALANAGANYQGTFFNNYLNQLAGLAGAGSTGAQGSMAGYAAGANTQNQSLQNLMKLWPTVGGGG
ncbi:hypothetical protein UFOVP2_44 [uncultured Caudovirales phage]|uniref:Uncharacterized protein n=1 Tax=uncultured Caudovirales phage TaxID=2100421 RepID=A0A6J5KKE4_9CAUD|nr:hypothetical protein UFOVP2_44 [uncultured Caudovirales phage]